MTRIERHRLIVEHLSSGRLVTGRDLADVTSASLRTIYRDIDLLRACGVRIASEAGTGYMLRRQEGGHLA